MHHVIAFMQWPYSLAVVPIRKLLQYSHCQGRGDTHHHLVGSHPQHHPYCIILRKCWHIMHDSSLAGTSSQSCSTMLYHVQSSQYTHDSVHSFVVLWGKVVMNAIPACMTLIPCSYSYCTYYANGRATFHLSGALLPGWRSIKSNTILYKESLWAVGVYIYTIYTIAWGWLAVLHLLSSTWWMACAEVFSCVFCHLHGWLVAARCHFLH